MANMEQLNHSDCVGADYICVLFPWTGSDLLAKLGCQQWWC